MPKSKGAFGTAVWLDIELTRLVIAQLVSTLAQLGSVRYTNEAAD
jgi:hypothetical protein